MRKLLSKLWADDGGFIISVEMLFITVILVIGLIAGWANLRTAVVSEFSVLGNAIIALNPGYEIDGVSGDTGGSRGSLAAYNGDNGSAAAPFLTLNDVVAKQATPSDIGLGGTAPFGNVVP